MKIGERVGKLTIIDGAPRNKTGQKTWLVMCDCGNKKIMLESNMKRKINGEKSCGCVKAKGDEARRMTYESWSCMMKRCYKKENNRYSEYGARGVIVCERWHDFENFIQDMGERKHGMSIDRINNSLGYSPDNCKWSSVKEQSRNRRSNILIEIDGITLCVKDWCDKLSIPAERVYSRIRLGHKPINALMYPINFRIKKRELHHFA